MRKEQLGDTLRVVAIALLTGASLATSLAACDSSRRPTAAPTASTSSSPSFTESATPSRSAAIPTSIAATTLTFRGAFSGTLGDTRTNCVPPAGPPLNDYLQVNGHLQGHAFELRIYDPRGVPDYESSTWVTVNMDPTTNGGSGHSWLDPFALGGAGITSYTRNSGATIDATVRPTTAQDTLLGGYNPYGELSITGTVLC